MISISLILLPVPFVRAEDKGKDVVFGGRLQNDWVFVHEDDAIKETFGDQVSGTEFRRARLFARGTLYRSVKFKLQFDFAGGETKLKDAYLAFQDIPYAGEIVIGHFKEPFSLEGQTSSKYITFLERALPLGFVPDRNVGIMVGRPLANQRITWRAGVFREADDSGKATGSGYNVSARVTGLPLYKDGGRTLVHFGVSFSHRNPIDDTVRFRQRPEVHLADRFVDTGTLTGITSYQVLSLESAVVAGRFSLQGEFIATALDAPVYEDPSFRGFYIFGSFFVTPGDHRRYKTSSGAFDRTRPERPLGHGGIGAVELAVRYSFVDLNSGLITGGVLRNITVALNWYGNNNTRVMLNYLHADRDGIGTADYFLARFQVDF